MEKVKKILGNSGKGKVDVLHPSLGLKNGMLYYGFNLPKKHDIILGEIQEYINKKKKRPSIIDIDINYRGIITDEYNIYVEEDFYDRGFMIVGELDSKSNYVSPKLVRNIFNAKIENVEPKKIYDKIKKEMKKYIYYQNEEEYDIVTLYIMSSLFYIEFNYFPILHFFADMGSGKTISGKFIQLLGFNGYYTNNISKAALTRELNNRKGIIIVDEKENINDNEELKYILNSCYSKGSQESLTESIQPGVWKAISLELFAPVVICSINPIYGATSDRIIRIDMKRMKRTQPQAKEDLISDFDDEKWERIRDELILFSLKYHKKARQTYVRYKNKNQRRRNPIIY